MFYIKKPFLKISQKSRENTCTTDSFLIKEEAWGLQPYLKKEILAQVFSFEFCEIFQNSFFTEHIRTTVSIWMTVFFCDALAPFLTFYFSRKRLFSLHFFLDVVKNVFYYLVCNYFS